jgi:serine/threonine-protein kinase
MQEARLAMRLGTHPNVVQVIDVGRHRDLPFIVMEYIDGTDLHQILEHRRRKKRRLTQAHIYNILASSAAALHHAHVGATVARKSIGVVHRDVKPANILVTRDGVVKLADFGIGTTVEDGTVGDFMRGTFRYMSPEHISREVRPEMDIYALGVTAWEMVENRRYREELEGTQHLVAIMDGDVPPMENPDTPPQLRSLIEACLEVNPRQRPQARELLRGLEQCPGYTRDPSDVQLLIAAVLGPHRSSGKTQHEGNVETPELAATFAALEVAKAARRLGIADEDPAPASGEPAAAATDGPPSGVDPQPRSASGSISGSDPPPAIDPSAPTELRAARVEADSPQFFHRPKSTPQPTPTFPFGDAPDAREPTLPLGGWAPADGSAQTDAVADPWASSDPELGTADVATPRAGSWESSPPRDPGASRRRATQPGSPPAPAPWLDSGPRPAIGNPGGSTPGLEHPPASAAWLEATHTPATSATGAPAQWLDSGPAPATSAPAAPARWLDSGPAPATSATGAPARWLDSGPVPATSTPGAPPPWLESGPAPGTSAPGAPAQWLESGPTLRRATEPAHRPADNPARSVRPATEPQIPSTRRARREEPPFRRVAPRGLARLRRETIFVLRKFWWVLVIGLLLGGLLAVLLHAYLVQHRKEAREPSRTTQMSPVRDAAENGRRGWQAWHDEPCVTISLRPGRGGIA